MPLQDTLPSVLVGSQGSLLHPLFVSFSALTLCMLFSQLRQHGTSSHIFSKEKSHKKTHEIFLIVFIA